jgi:hypothetical protein
MARKVSGAAVGTAIVATMGGAGTAEAGDWSISAKTWMMFDNLGQRQSALEGDYDSQQSWNDDVDDYNDSINFDFAGELGNQEFTATPTLADATTTRRSTQLFYPLAGVTLATPFPGLKNSEITFAGLYGEGHIDQRITEVQVVDIAIDFAGRPTAPTSGSTVRTARDVFTKVEDRAVTFQRADFEFTVAHRLNETYSLLWGGRWEHVDFTYDSVEVHTDSRNYWDLTMEYVYGDDVDGAPDAPELQPEDRIRNRTFTNVNEEKYDVYSLRFGAAAYSRISDNQILYVNGLISVGQEVLEGDASTFNIDGEETTVEIPFTLGETSVGPDISVGYLYKLGDRAALDLRYRGAFNFTVDGETSFEDPRVNHGLNIGLTVWF